MEPEDVAVSDSVSDGVGVQSVLQQILGGAHGGLSVLDLLLRRVGIEDGGASEAEELGPREELLDGTVVFAELGAMALVEDEDDPLVPYGSC